MSLKPMTRAHVSTMLVPDKEGKLREVLTLKIIRAVNAYEGLIKQQDKLVFLLKECLQEKPLSSYEPDGGETLKESIEYAIAETKGEKEEEELDFGENIGC